MKSLLRYPILFIASLLLLHACGKEEEPLPTPPPPHLPMLKVTPKSLTFSGEGGGEVLTITTNAESWTLTLPQEQEWVSATTLSGGEGTSTTTIEVARNEGKMRREVTLLFSSPECAEVKVTVSQGLREELLFYGGELYEEPDPSQMGKKTARELVSDLGLGWTLGRSFELPNGELSGGNPQTTKQHLQFIKSCGFQTIRIPVCWLSFCDDQYGAYHITTEQMQRVARIVDHSISLGLNVIICEHYDRGAFENLTLNEKERLLHKCEVMWRQIAIRFRSHNQQLLFAAFHENGAGKAMTSDAIEIHNQLLQRFVETVRGTGGRNSYRYLVVQPIGASMSQLNSGFRLPQDSTPDRLFVECHYFEPSLFCGRNSDLVDSDTPSLLYLWDHFLSMENCPIEYRLSYMEEQFYEWGMWCRQHQVGGLLGEYGAGYHAAEATIHDALPLHCESRAWWHYHITRLCRDQGICPILWDDGNLSTTSCSHGLIDRVNFQVAHPSVLNALRDGHAGNPYRYSEE